MQRNEQSEMNKGKEERKLVFFCKICKTLRKSQTMYLTKKKCLITFQM